MHQVFHFSNSKLANRDIHVEQTAAALKQVNSDNSVLVSMKTSILLMSRFYLKKCVWWHNLVIPVLERWEKTDPPAHWLASLGYLASSSPERDLNSQNKSGNEQHPGLSSSLLTHMHCQACTQTHTKQY